MDEQVCYFAGSGLITSIGGNSQTVLAAVGASISGYQLSEYDDDQGRSISLASVPQVLFDQFDGELELGVKLSAQLDRTVKMAVLAARECFQGKNIQTPVPFILSLPDPIEGICSPDPHILIRNIIDVEKLPIDRDCVRQIAQGRAAGLMALELAHKYLFEQGHDYVLVGASQSYQHLPLLRYFYERERLLVEGGSGGVTLGEGACFILLCRSPDEAIVDNGKVVAIPVPSYAEEAGSIASTDSAGKNMGEGLHSAVQKALVAVPQNSISRLYSTMNGEAYWAKEHGVTAIRNQRKFKEGIVTEHPADCWGDLGCASGLAMIALSADTLLKSHNEQHHLVCASSDREWRSAVHLHSRVI